MMRTRRRPTGFSLIELMTVVGIIGILAALSLAALEVLPQRTRLTGGALEFAAIISSARSQAYGRNQRVAVLINADTANIGNPIRYWVVVDKWSNLAKAMADQPDWKDLTQLMPASPPAPTGQGFPVYEAGNFNSTVRIWPKGFKDAVGYVANSTCSNPSYPDIRLSRGQLATTDDSFPAPYCFVPSALGCTFCSGDGTTSQARGAIFFEPDGGVHFVNAAGVPSGSGAASITLLPTGGGGLQTAQAVVITNTGLVRTFSASAR